MSSKEKVLSQHEKFRKAKSIIDQLPSLASEVGMDEFLERVNTLDKLREIWARGGRVIVTEQSSNASEHTSNGMYV